MKFSRRLLLLVSILVPALLAPVGAAARPPQFDGVPTPHPSFYAPPPSSAGAHLTLTRLMSAPVDAHAGDAYGLRGTIMNDGAAAGRGRVVVHLLRVGTRPLAIGQAVVDLAAHDSGSYSVRVRLPRSLRGGSYALVACVRRAGLTGALGCVTAERHLQIGPAPGVRELATAAAKACTSGAHSLSPFGAHVYPETGNGGYTSVHTDVFLNYDTESNLFLPGTRVVLTDVSTQCLTDLSLDFERASQSTKDGPDMAVGSVLVNGAPAKFAFVQPTYPGDPNGQNDPDPRAHAAGELSPVGGPESNPFPPACTPELLSTNPNKQFDLDGTQCPANKLVITPTSPIATGTRFVVSRQLHRPAGRAQRRRRYDRGVVQGRPTGRRRRLCHDRAGCERGLDAVERPSEREADL